MLLALRFCRHNDEILENYFGHRKKVTLVTAVTSLFLKGFLEPQKVTKRSPVTFLDGHRPKYFF
tara:strand:- start:111 stop:302 length:192 start_codon:yes stop_codon:yes gene_type:complete